jgi:imidazole glycerol-phosphate synthase subunit HisH
MLAVVVDTGLGNITSVHKAVETAAAALSTGIEVVRSADPDLVRRADRIVVPGQGGFRDCARAMSNGLGDAVLEQIRAGTPYLGICLGLQILFDESDEAPGERGFGVLKGRVERLRGGPDVKIPHIGWNQLELVDGGHAHLAAAGGAGTWFYFVHSYHAVAADPGTVVATSGYGENRICSAVAHDNVFATQFHPEKSQRAGLALLRSFLGHSSSTGTGAATG